MEGNFLKETNVITPFLILVVLDFAQKINEEVLSPLLLILKIPGEGVLAKNVKPFFVVLEDVFVIIIEELNLPVNRTLENNAEVPDNF